MHFKNTRKAQKKCMNVIGCLISTVILLCFAFFVMYKYTLIDADYVLRIGNGQAFDYGDYGIDVSALRAVRTYQNEEGNAISKVDQWDSLVKNEKGVRIAYVTDNCDKPTEVLGVAFLAKNDRGGLKVVVLVNYTAEKEISIGAGEAVILAKFGKVIALNQTLELCSVDEATLNCPIEKGFESYRREIALPKFAPKGKYHGTANIRYSDTKETQLCVKGMMIL